MQRLRAGILRVLGEQPGTGFAIAPGLIATCAHVVGRKRIPGETIAGAPWGCDPIDLRLLALDAEVDLALLLCQGPLACPLRPLPLDGDIGVHAGEPDRVGAVGFPASPDGRPERDELTARFEGETHRANGHRLLKLKDGQFSPGYSGAPLLNLRTGRVCGIVRETRDRHSDLGGRAIPVADLLALYGNLCAESGVQVPPLPTAAAATADPAAGTAPDRPAAASGPEVVDRLADLLCASINWQDPHSRRQMADRALWGHPLRAHLRLDANPAEDAMELAMACLKHDDPGASDRPACLVLARLAALPQSAASRAENAALRSLLGCP